MDGKIHFRRDGDVGSGDKTHPVIFLVNIYLEFGREIGPVAEVRESGQTDFNVVSQHDVPYAQSQRYTVINLVCAAEG